MALMTVKGLCPMGCGQTLMLANGGHVTCTYLPCPDPGRADYELNLPTHLRIDKEKINQTVISQANRIAELEAQITPQQHGSARPEDYMLRSDGTPQSGYEWEESMRCGERPSP